jgi:hypothetical protein
MVCPKLNTWVVYPGTFGGFSGLCRLLPQLKNSGINQIHILPFYEATGDDGFEVVISSGFGKFMFKLARGKTAV